MTDDERCKEEEAVAGDGALCLYIDLMYGNNLAFWSRRLSHHLQGARNWMLSATSGIVGGLNVTVRFSPVI